MAIVSEEAGGGGERLAASIGRLRPAWIIAPARRAPNWEARSAGRPSWRRQVGMLQVFDRFGG